MDAIDRMHAATTANCSTECGDEARWVRRRSSRDVRLNPRPKVAVQAVDATSDVAQGLARVPVLSHTVAMNREDSSQTDEALMLEYAAGSAAAFDRLYARHRGGLYRYLLRQCKAASVAEELFQDVWMSIIRTRKAYAPNARFATYLYRIAHNRLVDHFRRSRHRPSLAGETDDAQGEDMLASLPADPRDQPDALLQSKVRLERFHAALAALPDVQREAFIMREEGGLSVEEIAAATGVNAETAKSRLRYAIAKLRRGLEGTR
jgi:RNA polymerase sigma-70 factor (ECF subfamily)